MRILFITILISVCNLLVSAYDNTCQISKVRDNEPTIIIHDTVVAPGELLLRIDALNFVGDDGQVAAITLNIDIDTLLVEFISIQNMDLPGSWLGNYNTFQNEITITYIAPYGSGYDINGKLLDLKLIYNGGFETDLILKPSCEISNVNLQTITGIVYEDGYIGQIEPNGAVYQDSVLGFLNQPVTMPILAEGVDYDSVNEIYLRLGYDTTNLNYNTTVESALQGITIFDSAGILTCEWESAVPVSFATEDTMFLIQFDFIGDTNTITQLLPGSAVYNNELIVASSFDDGYVEAMLPVTLLNQPDTAGNTIGSGYYFIGDTVTATDSIYTFIKQASTDTLIANYLISSFDVVILITPPNGGNATGEGTYIYSDPVTVTASPELGYDFISWMLNNDIVSYDPIYSFPMPPNDITLTAVFNISVYTIVAEANNPDFGEVTGGGEYLYGDTATLIAIPNDSYNFIAWTESGQPVSYDSIYKFAVTDDRTLVGNFQYFSNCSAPVGLFAGNINESSTILFWVSSGSEEVWDLIWGETGFDTITGGNLVEGLLDVEYILGNLNPGTEYDFYVRAICNDTTGSAWSDSYTFATWYVGIRNSTEELFVVYPNPANTKVYLKSRDKRSLAFTYHIFNFMGERMDFGKSDGLGSHLLNVEYYPAGLYFIQLYCSGRSETISFVKR